MTILARFAVIGLVLTSLIGSTPPADTPSKLRESLTVAEFERMGLNRLSPAELAALEVWLGAELKKAADAAIPASQSERSVVESRIDGEFEGWTGETVFSLENGQIWRQLEYSYAYQYQYRPKVLITQTSSGWVMKVEGMSETIRVERLC